MHHHSTQGGAQRGMGAAGADTRRVLVVDDDPLQLALLQDYFSSKPGFQVSACDRAQAGLEAVRRFGAAAFVLAVVDLHMPGMDGFQFMEQLQSSGFRGGLAIVSGQGEAVMHSASLVARLRHFRLLGHWAKPVSRADLSAIWSQV